MCARIDEGVATLKSSLNLNDRPVHVEMPPDIRLLPFQADSTRMLQVIVNLLENAAQHAPDTENITVRAEQRTPEWVTIGVIDRGKGIPPENIDRVFEPFYTTRRAGTGLGLSIVKHITTVHNGTVSIFNNSPQPGVTVEITLPLEKEPSRSLPEALSSERS
jgi:signal transduction histidine kinase